MYTRHLFFTTIFNLKLKLSVARLHLNMEFKNFDSGVRYSLMR